MTENPNFQEPNPIQEPDTLHKAIATRFIHDHLKLNPDISCLTTPEAAFFVEAMVDATARNIQSALKTPTPYATIVSPSPLLVDRISDGDFIELGNRLDIDDSTPIQMKLYGKAMLIAFADFAEKSRLPEHTFPHFYEIIDDSQIFAAEQDTDAVSVFNDDKLYYELIKRNIPKEQYVNELLEGYTYLTFDKFIHIIATLSYLNEQIINDFEAVEKQGFSIDENTISSLENQIRQDKKTLGALSKLYNNMIDTMIDQTSERVQNIWGSGSADLPDNSQVDIASMP